MDRYLLAQREYRTRRSNLPPTATRHVTTDVRVPHRVHGAHQALHRQAVLSRRRQALRQLPHLHGNCLHGNYLISGYMAVKLLYVANSISQLFLLDSFLRIDYPMYGLRVVEQLIRGQDWGY